MPDTISNFNPADVIVPDTGMPSMKEVAPATNLLPSGADYAQSISSGQSITDLINEVQNLQAQNEAMLGGAGMTGISTYSPNRQYDANKAFDSFATQLSTPSLQSFNKPVALGKESDYNRYKDSKYFQTFGYTPNLGEEQEYKYGRAMTWGDTIGNALAGGTGLAVNTFVEGWKGWGRMAEALFTWDSSKLMGSEEERYQMAKEQEALMNKYAIYDTAESKDGYLNRQFFGNMLQQSGFAVGALAQFALEEAITGGIGGAISGSLKLTGKVAKAAVEAEHAASIAEKGWTLGRAAEKIAAPFKPKTIATIAELNNATRKVMNTITSQPKIVNSIANGLKALTPGYGTVEEMIKLNKAGAGFAQLAYTGLGGIRRGLSEFNMSRSESIYEAASTYTTLKDKLVEEYQTKNGALPTGADLEKIKQTAEDASHDNFWTNIGVLSVMNRIQFDNMFKSFKKSRTLLGEGASDLADKAFQVTGKIGEKVESRVYEKGLFGGVSAIGQVAKDFGKKKAAWEATKSIGKGLMKFEGSEGAQELIQTASDKGLEDYYYDLYHGKKGYGDRMDSVLSSIQNPLTDTEGMKTFLMGALTGRLIAPFSGGFSAVATKIGDARRLKADPNYKTDKQKTTEAVQMMNALYTDPQWFKKEALANIKVNNLATQSMEEAVANRDKYVFNNSKDSALAKTVAAAIKLDMYDSLRDVISEYGSNMTNEEFKQAFGIDPTETSKKDIKELTNEMVKNIEDYYDTFQTLKDKYADLIIPELYKNNSPEVYKNAKIQKAVLDDVIELIASNSYKAKQVIKRASGLQTDIASNKNIGGSSMQILTNLSSDGAIDDHIDILTREIADLEKVENATPEQKELLKDKKEELKLVQDWKDSKPELINEAIVDKSYRAYSALINLYNKRAKIRAAVSKEDVEDTFLKFTDYIKLNNDSQEYVDAMNLLADPKNMGLVSNAMASGMVAAAKKFNEEAIAELERETGESITAPKHTVTKEEDGTFTITSPDGTEVITGIATEEEANTKAEELDKKLAEELAKEEDTTDTKESLQEKLKDVKIGDTLTVDGKKAKVRDVKRNLDGNVASIDIEYPYTGTLTYTTAEEIASRQDTLHVTKDDNITSGKTGEIVNIEGISPKITLNDILNLIANSDNLEEVFDFMDENTEEKDFTEDELNRIEEALRSRKEELDKAAAKKGTVVFLKDTDPEFISNYELIQKQIADIVNKPDVTSSEVKNAFKLFSPLFIKLDPTTRTEYNKKHLEQLNKIVNEVVKEEKSRDIAGAKKAISTMLSGDDFSFDTTVEDVFNILNIVLKPELKEEAIQHFEQEYLKAIDKRLAKLRANANTGEVNPLIERLSKLAESFETKVRNNIQILERKAQELSDKKGDISFIVETNPNFENRTHRSILKRKNGSITAGQNVAIKNLQAAGMISEEDILQGNMGSLHGASEIINLGVARILTLLINRAAKLHFEKNDSSKLKNILRQYLFDSIEDIKKEEIEEDIEAFTDKELYPDLDSLLDALLIPKTEDTVTDEQYELIYKYRSAVAGLIEDGNIISFIESLESKQAELVSSNTEPKANNIITLDIVKSIEKYIKYDTTLKKKDVDGFYNDLLNAFNSLKEVKDVAEGLKIINDIVSKHIDDKNTDGKTIVQSLLNYALKTNNLLTSQEEDPQPLTEEQMKSAINTPTDSLTVQQIGQVEEFAKTTNLENIKGKLNAAAGYTDTRSIFTPEVKGMEIVKLTFNSLRQKNAEDNRSSRDMYLQLKAVDNQTSVKNALQFILDSEFATDFEKALAEKLLGVTNESDVITIDNNINALGQFDSEINKLSINVDATSYDEKNPDAPKAPIETVILHELMHALTQKAIDDPTTEYGKGIRSLFNAVKGKEGAKTFYAFQDSLTPDEQLHEFVAEAFTNPAFQYMLAKTPYANSKLTVWDKLMQIVSDILKAIGIDINNTALSEVLSLTDDLFNKNAKTDNEKYPSETVMDKIRNASTKEELLNIATDVQERANEFSKIEFDGLMSGINRKIQSIDSLEISKQLKAYKLIKVNGKSYYYQIKNGKVSVVKRANYNLINVRKPEVLRIVAQEILNKHKIQDLLPASTLDVIRSLGGNLEKQGTYASGMMVNDGTTIGEQRYPNAIGTKIRLGFQDAAEFRRFKVDYRKYKKGKMALAELYEKYNSTAVRDFGEIYNVVGDYSDITKLIKKGYIYIQGYGGANTLGDLTYDTDLTSDELFDMYKDVINNVDLDVTEYDDIHNYINKQLSDFFGFTISETMQRELEGDIFQIQEEPDTLPEDFNIEAPFTVVSDLASAELDASSLDVTKVDPKLNISAVNSNGLRSASFVDGRVVDGEYVPHSDFVNYYHKVRSIINRLAVANPTELADLHVTLEKDSADLRWDGSNQNPEWQEKVKEEQGVIGYISDEKGNPIIFNKEGKRVGVLDKNNLADTKGLDNGENQIVYFTIMSPTKTSKYTLNKINKTSLNKLFKAREAVLAGRPQISKLQKVDKGQMDLKQAVKKGVKFQRNTIRDAAMAEGLKKSNVSLVIDYTIGKSGLRAVITDSTGASSRHPLFTPNSRNVKIKSSEGEYRLFDHIFELMKLYTQMVENQKVQRIGDLQENLMDFARHIFLTGDKTIRFGKDFKGMWLAVKDENGNKIPTYLPLIDFVNGEMKVNQENLKKIKGYVDNMKINVYEKWLTGQETFSFPYITEENGEKVIKFEDKDFKNFLIDNVGLISYISNIPDDVDIMRYNSTVHFLEPSDLVKPEAKSVPTENQIVQDASVIKTSVNDSIKNTPASGKKSKDPTKGTKIFKSPSYENIFEKKCK